MATHLDLEEQEQLDQIKHFWAQYGNLITWALIVVLGTFAAWNGWNLWQRNQAVKAGAMYDELDKDAQAGDAARAATVFATLKARYPRTAFAQQGGLLLAKIQLEKGKAEDARATLAWVAEHASESAYQTVARLRLAALLLQDKKYDDALKQLDDANAGQFDALVADRRGDILLAQGKKDDARAAYRKAWAAMDPAVEYRRLVDAKLTALGAAPDAAQPKASAEATK
jgi:predicted negative regulator of RcsB-dependent stress response